MIDYKIVTEENLVCCNISGEVKTIDFQEYAKKLLNDKKFHLQLSAIINVNENVVVSYAKEAAGIGKILSQILHMRKGIFWAFVTKNQTTKGIVNLMMQEVDTKNVSIAYFGTEEEAKSWIRNN